MWRTRGSNSLAPAAVELFNGRYEAGEEMDPVFLGSTVPGE
ncbi:hypothetical protein [Arthrobacter sp. UYEF36]